MAHWTFQARGYCTRAGYGQLDAVLAQLCDLGNAALQERRDAWRIARKRINYQDQTRSLTEVRHDDPEGIGSICVAAARGALRRVDRAFGAFFRRCKEGGKPGYPRFRGRNRYTTIEINDVTRNQVRHDGHHVRVRVKGLPTIRLRQRRELPEAMPRSIRIVRRTTGCTVDLVYKHDPQPLEPTGQTVGCDLGARKRLTLSTGETFTAEHEDWKTIARRQRAVARSRRGSRRRRKRIRALARLRRKNAVRRRNACHRITTGLVRRFDTITVEALQIANMTRSAKGTAAQPGINVRQKAGLNRSILEQSWGTILNQLDYKAAWASRQVVKVNPRFTSQDCSTCGHRRERPNGRERWRCARCGTEHDRDENAAVNIDRAGIETLGSRSGERVAA